jgi:ABC-type nitrate/sulfonate/bicarbonate transport system substrate-binding protein
MLKTLVASLTIFIFQTSVYAVDKIRIAVPEPNAAYLTFPLAQKKDFLTSEGFEAEVVLMRGTLTIPALNAGDIDYLTGLPVGVRGAIAGFPLKIVACYLPKSSLMIISRPEINSVKDLKGKTVAVSSFGSTNSGALQLIAKHFGLNPEKEIKLLPVGANEARLAALRQGLVAAAVMPPPWDFHAKKLGFHVIARSYEFFSYPQVGLIVNERKIKQRPEEIKRMIKGGIEANRYIRSNREGTVQFLMEWMRIDKDVAAATYEAFLPALSEDGNCPEDGMGLVIEEAKKAAKINREFSIKDVTEPSILWEAQKELGIKAR